MECACMSKMTRPESVHISNLDSYRFTPANPSERLLDNAFKGGPGESRIQSQWLSTYLNGPQWDSGRDEAVEVDQRGLIDKILARYPGEFTVFRELLQNSDDAKSSTVEIRFETKDYLDAENVASSEQGLDLENTTVSTLSHVRRTDLWQFSIIWRGLHRFINGPSKTMATSSVTKTGRDSRRLVCDIYLGAVWFWWLY